MGKIFHLPAPDVGETVSYVFISDVHSLHCDPTAVNAALSFVELIPVKQRRLILGGDILDIGFHKSDPEFIKALMNKDWDHYFTEEMEKEEIWFDEFYKKLEILFFGSKIHYLLGNHEERLARPAFINQIPFQYRYLFDIRALIKAESRNIEVYDYNDYLKIKLNTGESQLWTHGIFCGANPINKHIHDSHESIIFGHLHELGLKSFKSTGRSLLGISNGCLCFIDPVRQPMYLENKNQNWGQGITVTTVTDRHIVSNLVQIVDGEIYLPTGEIIK